MDVNEIYPRILLIDDGDLDNVIFEMVIKKVLVNARIETCRNGQIAIERLRKINEEQPDKLPDYIFLDIRMPVMDGWEFLHEYDFLRIDPLYKSKIYVLSSSIDYKDVEKSLANPRVKDYLSKPIDMNKLKTIFKTPGA